MAKHQAVTEEQLGGMSKEDYVGKIVQAAEGDHEIVDNSLVKDAAAYLTELGWFENDAVPEAGDVVGVYCTLKWAQKHWR